MSRQIAHDDMDVTGHTVAYKKKNYMEDDEDAPRFQTQPAMKMEFQKGLCTVLKMVRVEQLKDPEKKGSETGEKGMYGFYLKDEGIFVPCTSKQQYFWIKNKVMAKMAKQKQRVDGFCFEAKPNSQTYDKLNNCKVNDEGDQLYDMNSCQLEKVEYINYD